MTKFYKLIICLGVVSALLSNFTASSAAVEKVNDVFGNLEAPESVKSIPGTTGEGQLSTVLSNIIRIIYIVSGITVVFMFLMGAFQWIISGGDKEKVAQARARITYALIGLVLIALASFILTVVGKITLFENFIPKTPGP